MLPKNLDREMARALADAGYMGHEEYVMLHGAIHQTKDEINALAGDPVPPTADPYPPMDDLAPLRNFSVAATKDLAILVLVVVALCTGSTLVGAVTAWFGS
jgi:hypothetical protein